MATDTSAPPIVEHYHLYPEGVADMTAPHSAHIATFIILDDLIQYVVKHGNTYSIVPCALPDCAPIPEPPEETTLDRLKDHVDSIADTLDTYGMTCFEQDEEVKARQVWEQAENEDLNIEFHEQGQFAGCSYCDVEIDLADDYSATTCGSADPCEHLAEVLATVQSATDAYTEVYGMTWTVAQDGEIMGVQLQVAGGGPNIYIDTRAQEIQGYWGASEYIHYLSGANAQAILEYFEDFAPEITRQ